MVNGWNLYQVFVRAGFCEDRVDPSDSSWLGVAMYVFIVVRFVYVDRKSLTEVCCFAV